MIDVPVADVTSIADDKVDDMAKIVFKRILILMFKFFVCKYNHILYNSYK
jgi:hypothetical protein